MDRRSRNLMSAVVLIAALNVALMWILPSFGGQSVAEVAPFFLGLAVIMLSLAILHLLAVMPVREPLPFVKFRVEDFFALHPDDVGQLRVIGHTDKNGDD